MTRPWKEQVKGFVAPRALALARRWSRRQYLEVDFLPQSQGPRHGYGRPAHARLGAILARDHERYRGVLEAIANYAEDLQRIPHLGAPGAEPYFLNQYLPGLDAASIYTFLRERDPNAYVEIGSGMSTMFARQAIDDGGLRTRITSIDPVPRARGANDAAHERIVEPLELVDLELFGRLEAGDVVFLDGSHRVLTNSDATVFFMEVLPELPDGVLVGVHDVLWPDDYFPEWTDYNWSEQYLVAAHLLAEGEKTRCELAAHYVGRHADLTAVLAPMWDAIALPADARRGFALWLSTSGRG